MLLNSRCLLLEPNSSFISKCQLNSNLIKYISMNKTLRVARRLSALRFGRLALFSLSH